MADTDPQSLPPVNYPPTIPGEMSSRSLGSLLAAGIGAVAGWFGADTYIKIKLYDFDGAVDNMVRNDVMNRKTGVGAGLESAGAAVEHSGVPLGNLGAGASSHSLRLAHEYNLAQSGQFPFARFVKRFGRAPVVLATTAVGGLLGYIGYRAIAPADKKIIIAGPIPDFAAEPSFAPPAQLPAPSPVPDIVSEAIPTVAEKPKDWASKVAAPETAQRVQGA